MLEEGPPGFKGGMSESKYIAHEGFQGHRHQRPATAGGTGVTFCHRRREKHPV